MLSCFKRPKARGDDERREPLRKAAASRASDTLPQAGKGTEEGASQARTYAHWLHVDSWGELSLQQADGAAAAQQFGISTRDEGLRFCPVKLAGRGQTLLVCLEGLRLLVAPQAALILSVPLGDSLQEPTPPFSNSACIRDLASRLRISSYPDRTPEYVDKSLPFQLLVLEWALATAAKLLTAEVLAFERAALPAVEALAAKVSSKSIASMRRVKFGLSDLSARMERFRQELQSALDGEGLSRRSSLDGSSTGGGRRERRRSRPKPLLLDPGAASELPSLLECYLIQVEAGAGSLRHIGHTSRSTEDMVRLSMKHQRVRLGPYC